MIILIIMQGWVLMKYIKYCKICGKEFEATHGNQKMCEYCRFHAKEHRRKQNMERAKERNEKLGVRTTLIYSKDIELLKSIKEHSDTIADAFHKILEVYLERKEK